MSIKPREVPAQHQRRLLDVKFLPGELCWAHDPHLAVCGVRHMRVNRVCCGIDAVVYEVCAINVVDDPPRLYYFERQLHHTRQDALTALDAKDTHGNNADTKR